MTYQQERARIDIKSAVDSCIKLMRGTADLPHHNTVISIAERVKQEIGRNTNFKKRIHELTRTLIRVNGRPFTVIANRSTKQSHSETRSTGTAVSTFRFKIGRTGYVDMCPAGIGGKL